MSDKISQIKRVERALKEYGQVSRNYYLDLPFHKITRLSDIILKLRQQGYDITTDTETDPRDTLYRVKTKRVENYKIPETGEVFTKNIYV